ncbi:DUF72 domain-containing protein [Candidatus Bathyarchaeota archaeon]|nr:MAG: DUF72 domain-containing protein [Candidatus Bathyarchaeota archaeon]
MSLTVGTSGWYYDEWVGPFYRQKKGMLTQYTKVFNTTEVNSTFYRYPSPRMVQGWYRTAPPGFVYALKLPKVITHDKWLNPRKGVEEDTLSFLDLVQPLAEKLGPILIQLRPMFNYEEHAEVLESYLESLPGNYEWAVEFRHLSWMRDETYRILERNGVAYTIVDEPLLPPEVHVTTDFAYVRWHGYGVSPWYNYNYSPEELEKWIPRVEEVRSKARRTYGYFNNHFSANAVKNAVEMLQMLGSATPQQEGALKGIIEHREHAHKAEHVQPLEAFAGRDDGLSVADHLMRFTTASRLGRAEKIGDAELTLKLNTGRLIQADIRSYTIEIDAEAKTLRHDCDDWRKGKDQKRICKHVAKLFLNLPEGQAEDLLTEMWKNRESWRFLS